MFDYDDIDCCPDDDGLGLGAGLFLGGALGLLMGGTHRQTEYLPVDADLGPFSEEEKDFLGQVWRFEKEIDSAWSASEWERLFCLLHAASASLNEGWAEFLPEHPSYDPTPKFHAELDQLLMPLLGKMQEGARLDFQSLVPAERMKALEDGNLSMNHESMTFTLNGQPMPYE